MVWRRSRRHSNTWQMFVLSVGLILITNMVILHRRFIGLEEENMVDTGGTDRLDNSYNTHKKALSLEHDLPRDTLRRSNFLENHNRFERRLRKLMEKSSENGLHSIKIEGTIPLAANSAEGLMGCDDIMNITERKYLASGWTKAVYSGKYKGRSIAVKTVDIEGQDVTTCVSKGSSLARCYNAAAQKIIKEILVLQALANNNVMKVLGFCVPSLNSKFQGVAMVTELGETVNLIKLLQMSWEDRFRVCNDITKIVHFMANTPYGTMAMNDFRRQQFVLVDGTLKLSDVDDVGFGDPACELDEVCTIHFSSSNFTQRLPCVYGKCQGFNEKRNLFNAARHFTTYLLPHGAPPTLTPLITQVVDGFANLTRSPRELVTLMSQILHLYKTGHYLNRTKSSQTELRDKTRSGGNVKYKTTRNLEQSSDDRCPGIVNSSCYPPCSPKLNHEFEYKRLQKMDLPGMFDYRCRVSLYGSGCTVSVFDEKEAEEVCDQDPLCKGFVFSKERTWTGRILVHMKSGVGKPTYNGNTTLFIRPVEST